MTEVDRPRRDIGPKLRSWRAIAVLPPHRGSAAPTFGWAQWLSVVDLHAVMDMEFSRQVANGLVICAVALARVLRPS
ncbi:hypothetical protein BPNPMPFG_006963 (plasmid) [Mesorhizobium sp. AR07]|uniref:hypothetical protein n=1 Tax=Mesorhizobium sp. AR07 TaxID=2865838 RepID=UPI0021600E64|nr:hypothetical protein [Mesorhizobium sp. AR07]UVK49225.1 hypothetical protein BPNPMPFG_006963 [Mesorhizobium sp. AR07]